MDTRIFCRGAWVFAGLVLALASAPRAADADDPLVAARQLLDGAAERGVWRNPLMPEASGRERARSGDEVLTAVVRGYTRVVLDRGGWVNPYVGTPGYDGGNVLFAVRAGDGVTVAGTTCPRATRLC